MLAALKVICTLSYHANHFLTGPVSFRDNQDSSNCQLIQEELRNFRGSCSYQDSVEGLIGRQTFVAITVEENGLIFEGPQGFLGIQEKLPLPLNGIHPCAKFKQNGGLISGSGSNFKDLEVFFYIEQLGLKSDRIGLRDGLPGCNREGLIRIGKIDKTAIHEEMPGNPPHGFKHIFVQDPLGSYRVYELLSQSFMPEVICVFHLDGQI